MNVEDIIRREQFCQIKDEIPRSDDYLVVGIDVAKDKHHAFMGSSTGKSLARKLVFENNLQGFGKLLQRSETVQTQHGLGKVVFGFEPTGNYHKPLGAHLIRCGRHVVLVTGKAVKNNRELLDGRWDKNDTKDAANIADLISRAKCLYWIFPKKVDTVKRKVSVSVFHNQPDKDIPVLSVFSADYRRLRYIQRWNVRYPDDLHIVHDKPARFSEH